MELPRRFGRFWLLERIGQGGMADVFRAVIAPEPEIYSFDFAVKLLRPELRQDPRMVEMFRTEEYVASHLVHVNLVRTYETGEAGGFHYIAMEYIHGTTLDRLLDTLAARRIKMPADLGLHIGLHVLRAIDYVHRVCDHAGKPLAIIHGDVTPANIFLTYDGEVKLGDFGVAYVPGLAPREKAQSVRGKVPYLPPEVLLGAAPTQAIDLWAAGICLYEMLSCRQVYEGLSAADIVSHAGSLKPPPLRPDRDGVDPELAGIVARMLSTRPARRPGTAADAYRALNTFAHRSGMLLERDTLSRFLLGTTGQITRLASRSDSDRDPLTGLHTHSAFVRELQRELDRANRYGRVFSVLCVDVDDFARLTQERGVAVGDEVLQHVAGRLLRGLAGLRSSDVCARRGADRFWVFLPETALSGAMVTAERIRKVFEQYDWRSAHPELEKPLTASLGIAAFPTHGTTVGALLEAADVARYLAKQAGKNRVQTASQEHAELKQRITSGTATEEEHGRWLALQRLSRRAHELAAFEDRRSPRRNVGGATPFARLATPVGEVEVRIVNAGEGGVRVLVPQQLTEGDAVELVLPLAGGKTARIGAHVAWAYADGTTGLEIHDADGGCERLTAWLEGAALVLS